MKNKHHKLVNAWFDKAEKDLTTVEIRYPDDSYEIHENDAKEAFEIAKEVKAYIFSKVSL